MTVHRLAARAWAGDTAEIYERARPGFPPEMVELLLERFGSREVLDLAAGTGKLTRQLVDGGARVTAVEPLASMRAVLEREVPQATALAGTAEQIPLDDASVDLVTVAQAFHWFDGGAAGREIARILRPGGGLAVIWNVRDDTVAWMQAVSSLIERHKGDTPDHASGAWRRPLEESGLFGPFELRTFAHEQRLSREEAVAMFASRSYVAVLPEPERTSLLDAIAGLTPRDEPVVIGYTTELFWACKST